MASFKDICFTPTEFSNIAKIDKATFQSLESTGAVKTIKRRLGNSDRKMITLEDAQSYFRESRSGRHGDQPQNTLCPR